MRCHRQTRVVLTRAAKALPELKARLRAALDSLDELDREVLTLRHFEHLSNGETALVLGIKESAACNRYMRALDRLRGLLARL